MSSTEALAALEAANAELAAARARVKELPRVSEQKFQELGEAAEEEWSTYVMQGRLSAAVFPQWEMLWEQIKGMFVKYEISPNNGRITLRTPGGTDLVIQLDNDGFLTHMGTRFTHVGDWGAPKAICDKAKLVYSMQSLLAASKVAFAKRSRNPPRLTDTDDDDDDKSQRRKRKRDTVRRGFVSSDSESSVVEF